MRNYFLILAAATASLLCLAGCPKRVSTTTEALQPGTDQPTAVQPDAVGLGAVEPEEDALMWVTYRSYSVAACIPPEILEGPEEEFQLFLAQLQGFDDAPFVGYTNVRIDFNCGQSCDARGYRLIVKNKLNGELLGAGEVSADEHGISVFLPNIASSVYSLMVRSDDGPAEEVGTFVIFERGTITFSVAGDFMLESEFNASMEEQEKWRHIEEMMRHPEWN